MQAGLFPRLRQQNILPVHIRLDMRDRSAPLIQQAAAALQAEIAKHGVDAPAPERAESLWEHLHGRDIEWWSAKNQPLTPLFVFDQFEEAFTLGAENAEAVERLRLDLADLIENRIPEDVARRIEAGDSAEHLDLRSQRYKVVLSFREDFLPEVEGWKGELPSLMRNRLRLLPMSADRALEVVSGETPAGRTHELVSDETAREIVRFVAAVQTEGDKSGRGKNPRKTAGLPWDKLEIEPALLSLLCQGLNEKRKTRSQATIDAALLKDTGEAIIGDFYRNCVADVPEKTRRFIEDALITEGGFRNSYPLEDALDQGLLTEPLLRQLVDRRLLRIDHQLGADRVELIHDRLTEVVREHRDRERERLRIQRQRQRWWATGSVGVVLFAIMLVFFSLWQNAQTALRKAVASKLVIQGRAILEGNKVVPIDKALLIVAAAYRLNPDNEAYDALAYTLSAIPQFRKVVSFSDPIISISNDGRTVVTGLEDTGVLAGLSDDLHPIIRLWDSSTGQPRGDPLPGFKSLPSIAFGPGDKTMVTGGSGAEWTDTGILRLWDTTTGQPRTEPVQLGPPVQSSNVFRVTPIVAFSPDGTFVVASGADRTLRLVDVRTGQEHSSPIKGHSNLVNIVAFSPDGKTLASASYDGTGYQQGDASKGEHHTTLRLWDIASENVRGTTLQTGKVTKIVFSSDSKMLASASDDKVLHLWDVASGLVHSTTLQTGEVTSVAFSPDGKIIVSGGNDGTLRVWGLTNRREIGRPLQAHLGPVKSIGFRDNQILISTGGSDKTLRFWDLSAWQIPGTPSKGHAGKVTSLAISHDGKTIVSGGSDGALRLWDAAKGRALGDPIPGYASDLTIAAFDLDGNTLVSLNGDGELRLWDVQVRESLRKLKSGTISFGDKETVQSAALSPDSTSVVLGGGSPSGNLRLVDVLTKQLRCKPWHAQNEHVSVLRVGFSPDSKTIISSTPGGISLWDATTCTQRGPWLDIPEGRHTLLSSVAISPDGRLVVSGEIQGNLFLWDAMSGVLRTEMRGHKQQVNSVSFSPDGKTIASAAEDGKLRLWASATGQSIGISIQGSKDALTSVMFSPDSRAIISGDSNGAVRVWDAPNAWIDLICDKLVHNLSRSEWKQYVGDISYVEQCPGLPVPAD